MPSALVIRFETKWVRGSLRPQGKSQARSLRYRLGRLGVVRQEGGGGAMERENTRLGKKRLGAFRLLSSVILVWLCGSLIGGEAFAQFRGGGGPPQFFGPPGGFNPQGGGPGFFGRPDMGGGPPWMRGGGPPGQMPFGPPGGFRPPGEGGRPPGGGSDGGSRFEGFLRSLDTNRDGVIDPREIPEDRRRFFNFMAERAGIDPNKPIQVDRFLEAARSRMDRRDDQGPSSGSGQPSGSSSSTPQSSQSVSSQRQGEQRGGDQRSSAGSPPVQSSLVPGFGVPSGAPPIPGFGDPLAMNLSATRYLTAPPGSSLSGGRGGSGDAERDRRAREFAESILRRYDRNRSGRLERDEWGELRGNPAEIDRNKDGVIVLEELQAFAASFGQRRESSGFSSSGSSQGEGGRRETGPGEATVVSGPKFVRFRRPHERLPEGLPEWFIQKDKDEDGQISMAEFSNSWSDATVSEFFRYDLDGDGVITPKECLDALAGKTGLMAGLSPGGNGQFTPAATSSSSPGSTGRGNPPTAGTSSSAGSSGGSRSAWDDPGSNFW